MIDHQTVEKSITALEAKRHILGDIVVDASLAALRKELAEIEVSVRLSETPPPQLAPPEEH